MDKLFICALLGVLAAFPSCGSKNKVVTADKSVASEQFVPDARFASIDSLVDFMTEGRFDETVQGFVDRYNAQQEAIKSYWYLNHKGESNLSIGKTVFRDLEILADSLSGGSTYDMTMCGRINCAMDRYFIAKEYCENHKDNALYQNEMRDWLVLEKELGDFYVDLAYLANWGGSIAHIISSGALAEFASMRQMDYSQLKRGGRFAATEMTIAEARENLIQELADAKSLEADDDMYDAADFEGQLKQMREQADKVIVALDKWLVSRARLCEAEGIPESHTAYFIYMLSDEIMRLIEQ